MRFDLKQRSLSQKTILFFKARQLCFVHPPTGSGRSVWVWLSFSGRWEEDQCHEWMLAGDPTGFHPGGAALADPPGAPLDPSPSWVLRRNPGQALTSWRRRWSSRSPGAGGAQAACRCSTAQSPGVPALSTHTHCLARRAPPAPRWALGSIILRASWF